MVTEDPHLFLTAIHECEFHFHGRLTPFDIWRWMVEQGKADSPAVLGPAYRILLRFRYTDPFWSVERCRQQNTGLTLTTHLERVLLFHRFHLPAVSLLRRAEPATRHR